MFPLLHPLLLLLLACIPARLRLPNMVLLLVNRRRDKAAAAIAVVLVVMMLVLLTTLARSIRVGGCRMVKWELCDVINSMCYRTGADG